MKNQLVLASYEILQTPVLTPNVRKLKIVHAAMIHADAQLKTEMKNEELKRRKKTRYSPSLLNENFSSKK